MKYLLILLFLFSTHSFSGEIDGKGLDCFETRLIEDQDTEGLDAQWREMFWFNNGMVQKVRGGSFEEYPKRKKLREMKIGKLNILQIMKLFVGQEPVVHISP